MKVFVTGSTGFIGSALVRELVGAGHQVLGLTRSDAGATALKNAGAEPHRGDLQDLESLRSGTAAADATVHLAFNHDFSKYQENCENDRKAIEAMGDVIVGTDKFLITTSGTGMTSGGAGALRTENDPPVSATLVPRAASEEAARAISARGGRVAIMRLPQVHNTEKQGLVTYSINIAREKKLSAYIGDGKNRWPAAHVSDTAHLYRLAVEKGEAGAVYHAVAEEGVPMIEIADVIGRGLNVPVKPLTPEEAAAHFGWMAVFAGWDIAASSEQTRRQLGWNPTGPGLIEDLQNMRYS